MYFKNFRLSKTWFDKYVSNPRFRTPFNSQHAKVYQTQLKSAAQYFFHLFHGSEIELENLFQINEVLGHFLKNLTAHDKYSLLNLTQQMQLELSEKQNLFSELSFHF